MLGWKIIFVSMCRKNFSAMICKLWWWLWCLVWVSISLMFVSWFILIFRVISNFIIRKLVVLGVMVCLWKWCCFMIWSIWCGYVVVWKRSCRGNCRISSVINLMRWVCLSKCKFVVVWCCWIILVKGGRSCVGIAIFVSICRNNMMV